MEITTTQNTQELERLEGIITRNLQSFYEVGRALMEIRDKAYYRDVLGFETFEAYCKEKWDINSAHAYRLIDSAMVIETVSPMGDRVPENERQTRPLARLEPEQQREAWQKAVETAPEGRVTAAHVSKVVFGMSNDIRKEKIYKINKAVEQVNVHPDFEKAYRGFYREVQNAKMENWKTTDKGEALKLVNYIIDLITII